MIVAELHSALNFEKKMIAPLFFGPFSKIFLKQSPYFFFEIGKKLIPPLFLLRNWEKVDPPLFLLRNWEKEIILLSPIDLTARCKDPISGGVPVAGTR